MITFDSLKSGDDKVAVVGLGYVGLPLAVQLAKHFKVVGFDLKKERISELISGEDSTLEVTKEELSNVSIQYTSDPTQFHSCRLIIVAVPTPIDQYNIPDLTPLRKASQTTGKQMKSGTCIVFESTVYPGATEEVCVPIIEQESGFTLGKGS